MARVLIVDDERSIRETLRAFLEAAGHEAVIAEDVNVAKRLCKRKTFDVVVTDIILPRGSGVELLNWLHSRNRDVQVIVMTGAPTADTAVEAIRGQAVDYLYKPINKKQIVRAVDRAAEIKALSDETRRLERVNENYRGNLEKLVAERTEELNQANRRLKEVIAELRQTQEQVIQQERLRAFGQMASGVAHDFNNTLTPILGFTEILLNNIDHLKKEKMESTLKIIRAAAMNAADVVARLREFYRPPDDRDLLQSIAVSELISEVLALSRPKWKDEPQARGNDIHIAISGDPHLSVKGCGSDLREMLMNLVFNAVDAMPTGGRITFRSSLTADQTQVRFDVIDTGVGMSDEVRRSCMDPFFTAKEGGTGLGLAVVYGIVQRHHGVIEVESTPGKGTRISISLPVADREEQPADEPSSNSVDSLRVLVVDDEPLVRASLKAQLVFDGHQVDFASDGEQAMQTYQPGAYDLVITDRSMPGVNGTKLCQRIKQLNPGQIIFMLTGFAQLMADQDDRPEHVDMVLKKPISSNELRDALRLVKQTAAEIVGNDQVEGHLEVTT